MITRDDVRSYDADFDVAIMEQIQPARSGSPTKGARSRAVRTPNSDGSAEMGVDVVSDGANEYEFP